MIENPAKHSLVLIIPDYKLGRLQLAIKHCHTMLRDVARQKIKAGEPATQQLSDAAILWELLEASGWKFDGGNDGD